MNSVGRPTKSLLGSPHRASSRAGELRLELRVPLLKCASPAPLLRPRRPGPRVRSLEHHRPEMHPPRERAPRLDPRPLRLIQRDVSDHLAQEPVRVHKVPVRAPLRVLSSPALSQLGETAQPRGELRSMRRASDMTHLVQQHSSLLLIRQPGVHEQPLRGGQAFPVMAWAIDMSASHGDLISWKAPTKVATAVLSKKRLKSRPRHRHRPPLRAFTTLRSGGAAPRRACRGRSRPSGAHGLSSWPTPPRGRLLVVGCVHDGGTDRQTAGIRRAAPRGWHCLLKVGQGRGHRRGPAPAAAARRSCHAGAAGARRQLPSPYSRPPAILRGTRLGDLTVPQPTKFRLGIKARTTKVLGLAISQSTAPRPMTR